MATIVNSAAAGALAAGITAGSAKAALLGGFTGGLFGAAGLAGAGAGISEAAAARSTERYLAHALAGCISAVAGGGKCGQGAVGAVFGKFTTNAISGVGGGGIGGVIARGVATSVAGGVGSVIAGGKFANGAETAAYGYLFNQLMSAERARAEAEARNRAVMGGACVAGFENHCAGLTVGINNGTAEDLGTGLKAVGTGATAAGFVTGNVPLMTAGGVLGVAGSGLKFYASPNGSSFLELSVDAITELIPAKRFGAGVGLTINAAQALPLPPTTRPLPQLSDLAVP